MRYHYTSIWMAKIQNTDNTKCWQGCGTTGILIQLPVGMKNGTAPLEDCVAVSYKTTHTLTEIGWDLGPGTLCCSACTRTKISSSNRIQRNYKGLKITAGMCSRGKSWTTRYKKAKPNCHFWGARSKSRTLCTIPAHSITRRWVDHLSRPSSLTHQSTPTLPPFKEPAHPLPPLGEQARAPHTCFRSLVLQHEPQ